MKKKITYITLWGAYLFSKVHICDSKIACLDNTNLEIMVCTFQKSCQLLKII